MSTSFQTSELIASHHAELDRLLSEILETGSRLEPDADGVESFRERVRALGTRLRAHRAEESAAILAEAGPARDEIATRLRENRVDEVEQVEAALARAEREAQAPLELARVVCEAARNLRAKLDGLAQVPPPQPSGSPPSST